MSFGVNAKLFEYYLKMDLKQPKGKLFFSLTTLCGITDLLIGGCFILDVR